MTKAAQVQQTPEVLLLNTFKGLVARDDRDLNLRQLAVFLTCYLEDTPQTVRELAASLQTSKPVITRALDRLGDKDLLQRKSDPRDRRSVLTQRTAKGGALLREIRKIMDKSAVAAKAANAETARQKADGRGARPARSEAA